MDFASVCRTCLGEHNLNPIFLFDLNNHEHYSTAIYQTAGVKVSPNDGLPQNMCTHCVNHLNNCLKFRKKCLEVETQLLNMKRNAQVETEEENSVNNSQSRDLSIDNIGFENVEVKTEDEEYLDDLDDNKLFISKSPCPVDSGSEDERPLKCLVECEGREKPAVVLVEGGVVDTDTTTPPPPNAPDTTVRRVSCDLCHKVLSIRSIKSHIARCHPGVDDRKEKCDLCDGYIVKGKMEKHKLLKHQGTTDKALRCGIEILPPKQTRQERLEKKRLAERHRREKVRNDPVLWSRYKEKERQQYLKKKSLGKIVPVSKMSPQQRKIMRQKSRERSNRYNRKKKLKGIGVIEELEMQVLYTDDDDSEACRPSIDPLTTSTCSPIEKQLLVSPHRDVYAKTSRRNQRESARIRLLNSTSKREAVSDTAVSPLNNAALLLTPKRSSCENS